MAIDKDMYKETDDQVLTLKTLKTPRFSRYLARILMGLTALAVIILFLPWTQNIPANGSVTAFSPQNRPQRVETAIAGRIQEWKVREGEYVNKGDTLLVLAEIKEKYLDPMLLIRLSQQIESKEASLEAKEKKIQALTDQLAALRDAFQAKLMQVRNKLQQAGFKVKSDSADYEAEKINFANMQSLYDRNKQLLEIGNITLSKYQEIESKLAESQMKLIAAENKFFDSKVALTTARVDISAVKAEFADKIAKAESDLNQTRSEYFEGQADLTKMRNEYSSLQERNKYYQIVAPQDGRVVQAVRVGIGETVKEGDGLLTILPNDADLAVQLFVQARDLPLVRPGNRVRIELDGWPALVFSGWPYASVGTFGGEVKVVDYVESKNGKFRVLIQPEESREEWPDQVRMGSGAKGWILLQNVPLYWELWRLLNGFPPNWYEELNEGGDESKKAQAAN